jgi:exodeoxyribonuclease VII large subunit
VLDSALPVVSAVGHETDFTICDFVADARAATPTAAAALVAPDRAALAQRLDALAGRLWRAGAKSVEDRMQHADQLGRRLVHPAARLGRQADEARAIAQRLALAFGHRLAALDARLGHAAQRLCAQLRAPPAGSLRLARAQERWLRAGPAAVDGATRRLAAAGQALAHLNPQAVLDRGYAIVTHADGGIVREASTLAVADEVGLRLARGTARARITAADSGNGEAA